VFALGGTVARTLDDSVTHLVATRMSRVEIVAFLIECIGSGTDTVKYVELARQLVLDAKAKRRSRYDHVVVCEPAWLDKCDREQPLTREQVCFCW
jgi:hypothetical protein